MPTRRPFLAAGALVGVAGCTGGDGGDGSPVGDFEERAIDQADDYDLVDASVSHDGGLAFSARATVERVDDGAGFSPDAFVSCSVRGVWADGEGEVRTLDRSSAQITHDQLAAGETETVTVGVHVGRELESEPEEVVADVTEAVVRLT